jgi:ammonia channel protein AmtB
MNSLMAMVGGTLAAWVVGRNDPGFTYNGPLAGLVAVCAGSDLMHPLGALFVGLVAGGLFVYMFTLVQNRWKLDDVLGVWPLHGLCGLWGGLAAGIFGTKAFGGLGGIMGGEASGCTEETKNVLIESAWFDPVRTATTGRKTGLVTDARYRFERGVDFATTVAHIERITALVLDICGGQAGPIDDQTLALPARPSLPPPSSTSPLCRCPRCPRCPSRRSPR